MSSGDYVCKFCLVSWPTKRGLSSHIQRTPNCQRFNKVRRDLLQMEWQQRGLQPVQAVLDDAVEDHTSALHNEVNEEDITKPYPIDDLYQFGPADYDYDMGMIAEAASAAFNSQSPAASDSGPSGENAGDTVDVEIEAFPGDAGISLGARPTKFERWRKAEVGGQDPWSSTFTDYWELAQWLVASGVSGQDRTDFVNLPQVILN